MPEDRSEGEFLKPEERLCEIGLTLVRYSGVEVSYSPKSGLKRHMWFEGHVEHDEGDDRFEGKPVRIRVKSPPDPELEQKIKTEEKVGNACGWFFVRANVEPLIFEEEFDDRLPPEALMGRRYWAGAPAAEFDEPPIEASLSVSPEAFDAVSTHAVETLDRLGRVRATIRLVGNSLPETGSGLSERPIHLQDLDVSERKDYAVQGFEIAGTRTLYPRKRVLPIERGLDDPGGTGLSILLTEASYQLEVATGKVYSVRCSGFVVNATGKPIEGAEVDVRLEEFCMLNAIGLPVEMDSADKWPEQALFGYFSYLPKDHDKEYPSDASFDFTLCHLPEDTRGLIIPILSQVNAGQVILTVGLTNEEEELLGATDVVEGGVRNFGFRVRSRSTNEIS